MACGIDGSSAMLRKYLLVAVRHLRRCSLYTVINIAGLAVGLACCVFITLFVMNELRTRIPELRMRRRRKLVVR